MSHNKDNLSANEAWEMLIKQYNIISEVKQKGSFFIKAKQIKKYKEPRLMAKWDTTEVLPSSFKKNKINILPISRESYVISDFQLYKEIPPLTESVTKMDYVELSGYESIDIENISSESIAINVLLLSGMLDDFLGTNRNVLTFNGRMGTGCFDFKVGSYSGSKRKVTVNKAQCEIDAGVENDESVVIIEAKNVVNEEFHIRQLYYPYRLWKTKVNKPIRLVFCVYSNMIYRLFEYRFADDEDYSSIELVQTKNYSLQDISITLDDLKEVRNNTKITTDDNMSKTNIPFIQANSMERIISLLEHLATTPMNELEIAELMAFDRRQSGYYFNAGRYLGIFEKVEENNQKIVTLTKLGRQVYKMNYKTRQLKIVELILKHKIFADCFDLIIQTGTIPGNDTIEQLMLRNNVCESMETIKRRASSVSGWLTWMLMLDKL